jgi:phage tail protein X
MQVRSQQGDTLDAIVFRYLGAGPGHLERTLAANPALAGHGAVLPTGTVVALAPAEHVPATDQSNINLWD